MKLTCMYNNCFYYKKYILCDKEEKNKGFRGRCGDFECDSVGKDLTSDYCKRYGGPNCSPIQ